MVRGSLIVLAVAGAAQAQPIAGPPPAEPAPAAGSRPHLHPHAGLGGGLSFGVASEPGRPTGWVARLDYELLPVLGLPGAMGGIFGFAPAVQYWQADGDWGIGMPVAIVMGVRAPGVGATGGVVFEMILVDQVADDTGVGFFAPFAHVELGVDVRGWRAGLDGRVTRRWQLGADDHTQWQASVFVGRTWETKLDQPVR